MMSLYGPLTRLYWRRLPGLVRGREHSAIVRAMKPRAGSASLAPTSWFTWSAWVKWCNAWGVASRIAFTGPPRSAKASPIGTNSPRLRCMVYSPMMAFRQEQGKRKH